MNKAQKILQLCEEVDKKAFLKELSDNTFCMLKPSKVHGIGVFAIRDIPEGANPFKTGADEWVELEPEEFKSLPKEIQELIEFYCVQHEGKYSVPSYGFKTWDMINFINHSKDDSNIEAVDDGDFKTKRLIKKGEELFLNYDEVDENPEDPHNY